jgi:hypothetical protein
MFAGTISQFSAASHSPRMTAFNIRVSVGFLPCFSFSKGCGGISISVGLCMRVMLQSNSYCRKSPIDGRLSKPRVSGVKQYAPNIKNRINFAEPVERM